VTGADPATTVAVNVITVPEEIDVMALLPVVMASVVLVAI
jgi:hypothetical protein